MIRRTMLLGFASLGLSGCTAAVQVNSTKDSAYRGKISRLLLSIPPKSEIAYLYANEVKDSFSGTLTPFGATIEAVRASRPGSARDVQTALEEAFASFNPSQFLLLDVTGVSPGTTPWFCDIRARLMDVATKKWVWAADVRLIWAVSSPDALRAASKQLAGQLAKEVTLKLRVDGLL
jgi:hypothetical protein